jgi:hypothetical protein
VLYYPASYAHGPFSFNAHLNADGSRNDAAMFNTFAMDEIIENPVYRDLRDPYHLTQGGQLGRVHKGMRVIQISGHVQEPDASQHASLADAVRTYRAAFDPSICYRDSPSSDGAYPFTYVEDTTDTLNWPSGRMALQYFLRPVQQPFLAERINDKGWRSWRVAMLAGDPRAFSQAEQSLSTLTSGNAVNIGNTAAPLKITVTMNGAGSASFSITRASVTCVFDLSGFANNDVLIVLCEKSAPYGARGRYITKNGVEAASLKTSAPSTWLDVPVGTTSFTISNTTNVRTCVLNWYHAWA